MLLKLTVAYDGTRVPRLGAPARRAHGRGRPRRRARLASTGSVGPLAVAGRTDAGRARARERRLGRGRAAGRRQSARLRALNAVLPSDLAVIAASEAPAGVPRALLGALALLPLPHLALERALAVRGRPLALAPGADRPRAPRGERRAAPAASTTSARSPRPTRSTRSSSRGRRRRAGTTAATRSSSRSPPTRSCATWCGRSSGRCSSAARTRSRRCSTGAGARPAGSTAPPCGLYLVAVGYDARRRAAPRRRRAAGASAAG